MLLDILGETLRILAFVIMYWILGFVPGYYLGVIVANRLFTGDNPSRKEKSDETAAKAFEHNKQWHPDDPRWS